MIIDLILDRKAGVKYDADRFFHRCLQYGDVGNGITKAMTYGDEEDVKSAICEYVIQNDYPPEICDYVRSVRWTNELEAFHLPYFI